MNKKILLTLFAIVFISFANASYWEPIYLERQDFNQTHFDISDIFVSLDIPFLQTIIEAYNYLTSSDVVPLVGNWSADKPDYVRNDANLNMTNYNFTIGGHFFYYSSGECDLTINHSTCTNVSGTLEVG